MPSHLPSPPSSRSNSPNSSSSTSQPEPVEAESQDRKTQDDEPQHQPKEEEGPSKEVLSDRLDALLMSYLTILDTYTSLRAQLSKDLSAGFFSLAQANRNANSTLGVGRRYGEEGFDERMKAGRVVRIKAEAEKGGLGESCANEDEKDDYAGSEIKNGSKTLEETMTSQRNEKDTETTTSPYRVSVSPPSSPHTSKDPLKWYGILIPPSLRTCQIHFARAISSTVPDVMNTSSAMRDLEEEIWAVRRQLGIIRDDDNTVSADEFDKSKNDGAVETDTSSSKTEGDQGPEISLPTNTLSSSRPQMSQAKKSSSLSSTSPPTMAPYEPRSRILKLD
ncbi:uncharacterized protein Z519_08335 [Cladophialophora bantiana CBS 173.52]|uniref:Vacuolar ATPase assembly protein VMA22 n=1 Tax=Cladophialophora bantiana (strain ATCC 10958 / CBS 173.52 / CDC B-1940 / NIH 8579) TaxID=1442370 RepID=A0A0D2I3H5_CLAB1|nr:uncharacterized protein Z519_08335 [Cladophialophora bantiana CBS 173.52]KIW91439.1 hypothetical protein Z519_08335 [Cladophialophora bantiana CBS 173.52]